MSYSPPPRGFQKSFVYTSLTNTGSEVVQVGAFNMLFIASPSVGQNAGSASGSASLFVYVDHLTKNWALFEGDAAVFYSSQVNITPKATYAQLFPTITSLDLGVLWRSVFNFAFSVGTPWIFFVYQ